MTQKNRTLEGKNRTLGGEGGSKIIKNCRTSFMYVPLSYSLFIFKVKILIRFSVFLVISPVFSLMSKIYGTLACVQRDAKR